MIAVFATEEGPSTFDVIGNVIPVKDRLPLVLLLEEDSGTFSISIIFFRRRNGLHRILAVSLMDAVDLQCWNQHIKVVGHKMEIISGILINIVANERIFIIYLVWLMDNDVEGDPDDGDEIVDELTDGTNTSVFDACDRAWEVSSSALLGEEASDELPK